MCEYYKPLGTGCQFTGPEICYDVATSGKHLISTFQREKIPGDNLPGACLQNKIPGEFFPASRKPRMC